ncbi:MAG: TonB-dependent receptor plug domain-containing protein, partial [Mucilaginibacter sp.]
MKAKLYLSKIIVTFSAIVLCTLSATAQNTTGKISGVVKNSNGDLAHLANVTISGSNIITGTDENGAYSFENIKPGTYALKVTFVGTKGAVKKVIVTAGETTEADFFLVDSRSDLKEVTINAGKPLNTVPVSIGKAGIRPLDLPQSTGVVSKQVIEDQQVNRLGEAIRNVSGVTLTQTRGGVGETFTARGYSIGINGGAGSIFQNGVLVNTAGFPETSSLQSIEVLKGSAALLY